MVPVERGPFSMEFATEEVLAGPYVLQSVRQAENDCIVAVVLDCMVDLVLRAARETNSRCSRRASPVSQRRACAARASRWSGVCSMHVVDAPPADLIESQPYCLDIINREIDAAHRAEVILFGCTAMSGYTDDLKAKYRPPIIEPDGLRDQHGDHAREHGPFAQQVSTRARPGVAPRRAVSTSSNPRRGGARAARPPSDQTSRLARESSSASDCHRAHGDGAAHWMPLQPWNGFPVRCPCSMRLPGIEERLSQGLRSSFV